jgi:DNA repair exonuclease SbcCD ATPase subunit
MSLLLYAIIATLIAAGLGYALYVQVRKRNAERQALQRIIDQKQGKIAELQGQVKNHRHAIKRMEEVNRDAAKKKQEIRKHSDSRDRANAATRLMSKLSGGGDSNGDGSAPAD